MHKKIDTCSHFSTVLDSEKQRRVVERCIKELQSVEFDTLAFIGLSGAVIAPILAYVLGKELLMIRKNGGNDGSNSCYWIEGNLGAERVVIVDDIISTGYTMSQAMHALRAIQKRHSPSIQVVGLLLHSNGDGYEDEILGWRTPKLYTTGCGGYAWSQMIQSVQENDHPVLKMKMDYSDQPPLVVL